jgi:hypothetical protein
MRFNNRLLKFFAEALRHMTDTRRDVFHPIFGSLFQPRPDGVFCGLRLLLTGLHLSVRGFRLFLVYINVGSATAYLGFRLFSDGSHFSQQA